MQNATKMNWVGSSLVEIQKKTLYFSKIKQVKHWGEASKENKPLI